MRTPQSDRLKFLQELELIVPDGVPADEREIPLDLTDTSSRTVGAIHSEFTARLAYALFHRAQVAGHVIQLRREVKLRRAMWTEASKGEGEKKYELDAEATLVKDIREHEDRLAEQETYAALLDGVLGAYEKIVEGASREMSRRSNERTSRGD